MIDGKFKNATDRATKMERVAIAAILWVYDQSCAHARMELEDAAADLIGVSLGSSAAIALRQLVSKGTLSADELKRALK